MRVRRPEIRSVHKEDLIRTEVSRRTQRETPI